MTNASHTGDTVTVISPGTIASGAGVLVGSIFGIAAYDSVSGDSLEVARRGVFNIAKDANAAAQGQRAYWDDSAKVVTAIPNGTAAVGYFETAALSGDATGAVVLAGTPGGVRSIFVSAELTGTGSAQNVAHGLGVVPANVVVTPTDTAPSTAGVFTVTEGTHTTTNAVLTVTANKKFKVLVFA